jgi:hypothetical protein
MIAVALLAAMFQQPIAPPRTNAPIADTSIFRRLELTPGNRYRSASGAPGPEYWQQRVDYNIAVTLDVQAHKVSGQQTVTYHNNSPDTLRYLWFQTDQNLFATNSRGSFLAAPDTRFGAAGFEGGYQIGSVQIVRGNAPATRARAASAAAERRTPATFVINGTMMRVDLDQPLPPRGTVRLAMEFSFNVPEHGGDRMGREEEAGRWLYEIAQWQPRAAVYDDIRGWNTEQYLGQGEFYREFGDFDYAITLPRDYVVLGTGSLQNRAEVLTPEQIRRLDMALRSDTTVPIIAKAEVGTPGTRPSGATPTLTWHFRAENVHDVAWGAAPNFIWDASGWNNILMQSFYPVSADSAWHESTKMVRHSISHYSQKWFQYPWPTAINIAGPVNGMEYPMIVFCGEDAAGENLYNVTTHELGHEWFPMIVSSNERLYPWMDEGFNTFINYFSTWSYYNTHQGVGARSEAGQFALFARSGYDSPIIKPADRTLGPLLGYAAYVKPGVGLLMLRHAIFEDSTRFDSAFREYIRRWAFKHPTPTDFFRSMEDNFGEDLSWFWRGWIYRTDRVDQAIDSVTTRDSSGTSTTRLFLSSPGTLPMPVDLRVTYGDGSTEHFRLPVEIWYTGNRYIWVKHFPKSVSRVEIDPDFNFPDVDRANNAYPRGAPGTTP